MTELVLFLAIIIYLILSEIAIAAYWRAKTSPCDCGDYAPEDWSVTIGPPTAGCDVCGIPPRKTRRYDHGVAEIVTWDSRGEFYHFIFTADQMSAVLARAFEYSKDDDLGFSMCNVRELAVGLDFCRRNMKANT